MTRERWHFDELREHVATLRMLRREHNHQQWLTLDVMLDLNGESTVLQSHPAQ